MSERVCLGPGRASEGGSKQGWRSTTRSESRFANSLRKAGLEPLRLAIGGFGSPGQRDGVEHMSDDPGPLIARLKQQPGKDIRLWGGGQLAWEVLKSKALNEVILEIAPVLMGQDG